MVRFSRKQHGLLCFYFSGHGRSQLCWRYVSATGEQRQGTELSAIPAVPGDRRWLAIPAERCLFYHLNGVKIPRQALRWQLEDVALGDIGSLHITTLAKEAQQQHLVAVDSGWLSSALASLAASGFAVEYALPDVLLLPVGHAALLGEQWLARTLPYAGLSLPVADLPLLQTHDASLAGLPQVEWTAIALKKPPFPSLLHGKFAPSVAWGNSLHRLAAGLLLSAAALVLVPLWQGWQLQRASDRLSEQTLQHYHSFFPGQPPADPPAAFLHQLHQRESFPANTGLLSLMADSQALLVGLNALPLQTLEWNAGHQQLRLQFSTPIPAERLRAEIPGIQLIRQGPDSITIGRKP
ncbi:type II secretion system protein GspL [Erwinia sp. Eh17-17]|uniref:type II secretion system protein GspL n=1 Tax=Erwinia sp. Eh17-17 TaxID=3080330 RepID=UPI003207A989